jgi:hypothetical protein
MMTNQTIEQTWLSVLGIRFNVEGETCVVSHPEAGGVCGREATMTCYGLAFCEAHGEECALEAIEGYALQVDEYPSWQEAFERRRGNGLGCTYRFTDEKQQLEALEKVLERPTFDIREQKPLMDDQTRLFLSNLGSYEEVLWRAYPLREELVYERTRTHTPEAWMQEPARYWFMDPYDYFSEQTSVLHGYMRYAFTKNDVEAVRQLEPLRERATAQMAYAYQLRPERYRWEEPKAG